ncbi:putative wall-associated receptor kinase, galacturonan-binding domain-containing protein [Helianthus anomalus]
MYNSSCSCFILFVLLVQITIPTCVCSDDARYTSCDNEFACGSLTLIKYPFWGVNRSNYCGKQTYKLDCVNNIPVIEINSLNYRVNEFNYYSHTITVARMDYWGEICPSRLVNTTIDFAVFNYTSATRNLTLGYGCPLNPHPPEVTVLEYLCTINNTKTNVIYDPSMSCNRSVVVPAFRNVASDLDQNRTSLVDALRKGFALKWYVTNEESEQCKSCIISDGSCGVHPNNDSFVCYCYNGPSLGGVCDKRRGILLFPRLLPFMHAKRRFN